MNAYLCFNTPVKPGFESLTKWMIAHCFSRSGWNPVSEMTIGFIGSSIFATGLPIGCVVVVAMLDIDGGGESSFWRLRGDSRPRSASWRGGALAILGKASQIHCPGRLRVQKQRPKHIRSGQNVVAERTRLAASTLK